MTGDSSSPEQLWQTLMDGEQTDEASVVTAADINTATLAEMSALQQGKTLQMRLAGAAVQRNRVAVKTAASALSTLQEVISSIGAARSGQATLFGQISREIRSATELQMTPVTTPGSVVFTLLAEPSAESTDESGSEPSLLAESLAELLRILNEVANDSLGEQEIARQIRGAGPRAAKHLQSLSDLIVADDISMELTLGPGTQHRKFASLDRRSAAFLKEIIKSNAIDVSEETLEGILVTVSSVDPAAILLDDGEKVSLRTSPGHPQKLQDFYDQRVRVTVRAQVRRSVSTGRETTSYDLLHIELSSADR
ncbi:hypothetical protein [Kineosporia babensis]|uniref:Uncharacterized protein n=1 Tax=Kineosporia babensis TaxID=499548 RepID=A0A9X1SY20_9ACTN|nr:hypothetical protein [Kineosporia babensis]MCD5315850.1 hypothetical protein [Kineosporia babensis]